MTGLPAEYGPLVRELHARAAASRQPVNGTFELTERCNLSCPMCYVALAAGDVHGRAMELSASEWLKIGHEAVENGMVFLLLTGGEVFLRPDFFKIYMPLTRLGLMITLFTNGTLVTDRVAGRLSEAPPSRTEITLYGATEATFEAITRVPGSYTRCCAGIEALVRHRVPLGLKTTITQRNVGELEAMRQMARNWGLPFSSAWLLTRRRDRQTSAVEACRLGAPDGIALEASDRATADDWIEAALRETPSSSNGNFYCHAGKAAFVVSPAGEMHACLDLNLPAARPLEIGFASAWQQVQGFVDGSPPLTPPCLTCDVRPYCPRCPAWSYLENGTLTGPVPYLCEIARARRARFQPHA